MSQVLFRRGATPASQRADSESETEATGGLSRPVIRRIVVEATVVWFITRLLLVALTFLVAPAIAVMPGTHDPVPALVARAATDPLPGPWFRFDAIWYVVIGAHGYESWVGPKGLTSFFPLYPLQIHLLSLIMGLDHAALAAMALSNLATLCAFVGLGLLALQEGDPQRTARNLIKIVAAYPLAYFLFAPYTEGFFLACIVFCFLFARRGWWWWAALCAFLAGLTRPTGVLLALPLAWEFGRQQGWRWPERWRRGWRLSRPVTVLKGAVVIGAIPAAVGSYLLFCALRFGDPLLFSKSQALYHSHATWLAWQTLKEVVYRFLHPSSIPYERLLLIVDGGALLLFLALTLVGVRRLPFIYTLYMLGTLILLLSIPVPVRAEVVPSSGRYMLMAVPAFLLFARWSERRPWLGTLLIGGGFLLQGVFALMFLNGYWLE